MYKAVSQKPPLPVLSGILIETTADGARMVGYDLDLGIETFIPVVVERDGSFVFPARYLSEITRKLPHSEVTLEYHEDTRSVEITSDRTNFTVKTMPSEDFPALPEISLLNAWSMNESDLRTMIRKTAIACAVDDSRTFLTGIYTVIDQGAFTMVATDTFRLAHRRMGFGAADGSTRSAIIPGRMLTEVEKSLNQDGDREVETAVTDRHAMIRIGHTTYISRLLEGKFPNYRQVFPESVAARIMVDRNLLLASIERVSLMCKDDLSAVRISYSGEAGNSAGFLTITANTPEIGQAREDIPVSMEGHADFSIALRAKYLRDVLRVLEGDEVSMGYTTQKHPIEVKDLSDADYTYLVMPVTA